jgi:hypothetical protein
MKKLVTFLFAIGLATNLVAKKISVSPVEVWNIASKHTDQPDVLVGIAYTESSFGKSKIGDIPKDGNLSKASFGVCQIKLETVRFLAKRDKSLAWAKTVNDRTLISELVNNDKFNIIVASKYINWLKQHNSNEIKTIGAISRYNGGNNNIVYINRIMIARDMYMPMVDTGLAIQNALALN